MHFLDMRTDFAFKKVFGSDQSKDILLSFLNAMIRFDDSSTIVDLTIVDPYQIPMLRGMKDTYVDVKAVLSSGQRVIIEMQVLNIDGFEKRVLFNAAKAYVEQLDAGQSYSTLEPIIALTITDFTMFAELKKVVSYFHLLEKEALITYSGDIELIFIELPKFLKTEQELTGIIDKWIFFLKNAGSLAYIPESLAKEPSIQHAFAIANTAGLSPEELDVQQKKTAYIHDFQAVQRKAAAAEQKAVAAEQEKAEAMQKAAAAEQEKAEAMQKAVVAEQEKAEAMQKAVVAEQEKAEAMQKAVAAEQKAAKAEQNRRAQVQQTIRQLQTMGLDMAAIANITGLTVLEVEKNAAR